MLEVPFTVLPQDDGELIGLLCHRLYVDLLGPDEVGAQACELTGLDEMFMANRAVKVPAHGFCFVFLCEEPVQ